MIITRTPFRISFCGGGTDIPSYYRENGGCVVSSSIDKYVFITLTKSFHPYTILKYSEMEKVDSPNKIKHPIFKEILSKYNINEVEINSISNIPAGTGLGTSSAFTVGVINSIRNYIHQPATEKILAEEACDIEINKLNSPIGKQDQYASAFGGLNFIKFNKNDSVDVEPIALSPTKKKEMFDNLMMFYVGGIRNASDIIKSYNKSSMTLSSLSKLAIKLKNNLSRENITSLGKILDEEWNYKKTISKNISNRQIDEIYDIAIDNGAIGGKLLGAGSGGFMLFFVEKDCQKAVAKALSGYDELIFSFDDEGSKVVYNNDI